MTEPTKISLDKLLEEVRGKCHGKCSGMGEGWVFSDQACPEPCDPELLRSVKEQAQNGAWTKAQEKCKEGGELCMCVGEYQAWVPEQCVPIKFGDGRDACLYFAYYAYVGECKTVI